MGKLECGFDLKKGWFRLRAAAIILEEDCVLLAQNVREPYYYSIGGAVCLHESLEEAVVRECREETGLTYQVDRLCFIHENFFFDQSGRPFHELAFYYLMKPRGSFVLKSHDVSMYGHQEHAVWVPLSQLSRAYAYPVFFQQRLLEGLPLTPEHIITRESREEHLSLAALASTTTAFLPTDHLEDGCIALRCQYRMERNPRRGQVPVYRFDIVLKDSAQVVGRCELRLGNEAFLTYSGNIGYSIEEAFQGQGYATRACKLLLDFAKAHGMPFATITCAPENLASARVIQKAGAVEVGVMPVPSDHPMYAAGSRRLRIFKKTF